MKTSGTWNRGIGICSLQEQMPGADARSRCQEQMPGADASLGSSFSFNVYIIVGFDRMYFDLCIIGGV